MIESSCKHIVAARLKQAGMKWSPRHVPNMLAVRVCRASGWWDKFWGAARPRAKPTIWCYTPYIPMKVESLDDFKKRL